MNRIFVIVVSAALLFMAAACSSDQNSAETQPTAARQTRSATINGPQLDQDSRREKIFRSISAREAQALVASRSDLSLVDLREESELKEGYIPGSQLIPISALSRGTRSLPADRPLLLICAVGGRSYAVGRFLSGKGYEEVYNLKGGISDWKKAGLPLQY